MLRPEPLDLNDVVREMGTILARTVGAAMQIEIALAGEHAGVLADRGQLTQSLLNLAFNARDAIRTAAGCGSRPAPRSPRGQREPTTARRRSRAVRLSR